MKKVKKAQFGKKLLVGHTFNLLYKNVFNFKLNNMLKSKKDFVEEQLNIKQLTPLQWDGIMRAMDNYAQYFHKEQVKKLNVSSEIKYLPTDEMLQEWGEDYADEHYERSDNPFSDWWLDAEAFTNGGRLVMRFIEGDIL
jgi:hypothetical protein